MKSISELSLIHNRLMLAIVSILMVFGLYSYFTLPAQEDPDITIREALVTASYPGLPADKVELLITKTLEEAARKLPEIDEIRSVSMTGQATLHVKIKDRYFELEQIWDAPCGSKVKEKVYSWPSPSTLAQQLQTPA